MGNKPTTTQQTDDDQQQVQGYMAKLSKHCCPKTKSDQLSGSFRIFGTADDEVGGYNSQRRNTTLTPDISAAEELFKETRVYIPRNRPNSIVSVSNMPRRSTRGSIGLIDVSGSASEEEVTAPRLAQRRVSMETVALATLHAHPMDDTPLSEKCKQLHKSPRMIELLKVSWDNINAKLPSIVEAGILNSVKVFKEKPQFKTKYPFLCDDKEAEANLERACSIEHIHHTMNTINLAISHLENEQNLTQVLRKMGARHVGRRVAPQDLFQAYMESIAYALKRLAATDLHCSTETLKCWEMLCHIIGFYTVSGFRRMSSPDVEHWGSLSLEEIRRLPAAVAADGPAQEGLHDVNADPHLLLQRRKRTERHRLQDSPYR